MSHARRSSSARIAVPGLTTVCLVAACSSGSDTPPPRPCTPSVYVAPQGETFRDISERSGIQHRNFVAAPSTPIPINDHSRLAFVDLDGDGFDDIVAHSLYPNPQAGIPFEHLVFLNNGDKTFRDFGAESGLGGVQAGFFAFGDVDNDGDQDCFAGLDINLPGETSALYINDGKGHFTRREDSGLEAAKLTAHAVFADFDNDGRLDLFAGNGGTNTPTRDQLFFGLGDGSFVQESSSLAEAPAQPTNGAVACDYDDDGDLDLVVSTYGVSVQRGWNVLWENDGRGHFTNVARERGFHALATGNYHLASTGHGRDVQPGEADEIVGSNGFGVDCQDVDGDGHLDILLATISHPVDSDFSRKWSDPSQLLLNTGPAGGHAFRNVFLDRGLPFNEGDIDAALADFDNDGRLDVSFTRERKYEGNYSDPEQQGWFGLMHQNTDGHFTSVGLRSGINDLGAASDRAKGGQNLAWADIDHDGDLDLLVGGRDNGGKGRANYLFENTLGQNHGWLTVRLIGDGVAVNRDALGARVTVKVGDRRLVRELRSARGTYASQDSRSLHFGLADQGCEAGVAAVSLEVRWPDGKRTEIAAGQLPIDQAVTIDYHRGLLD